MQKPRTVQLLGSFCEADASVEHTSDAYIKEGSKFSTFLNRKHDLVCLQNGLFSCNEEISSTQMVRCLNTLHARVIHMQSLRLVLLSWTVLILAA